ncbi:hypothetical protein F5051DRAFT_441541 [Lentinula edodes]|nr:hypothetical protein F5051DRAFT_441541 [Lentinula edodes]
MPNVVDRRPSVTFGKRKRSLKKDRQEHTAAARLARQFMLGPNQSPPGDTSDADDDKENNGFNRPGPSDASQKQKNCADVLKSQTDNFRKKAKYWHKETHKSREKAEGLNKALRERENELKDTGQKLRKVVEERDERIEVLKQETRRQKIVMEDIEARLQKRLKNYQHQIHALKAKISRIPSRLVTATNRVVCTYNTKADDERTFFLKDSSGIIPDEARDVFLDLVAMYAVPANKVTRMFKRIAGVFGVQVEGDVSRRSVGQITKEGGNTSKLQIIEALKDAKGITLSGDGTTHKNETYESKFATVITPNKKLQFFLGLKMALNHTSETQLEGWIETAEDLFHLAYRSGLIVEDDARIFWNLVTGFHSDHAADQKKLFVS